MAFDIKVIQHTEYLEVVVSGEYDLNEAIERFPHVLSVCRLTGLARVVLDGRGLESVPRETEKLLYAFGIQEHYQSYIASGGHPLKLAYLAAAPTAGQWEAAVETAQRGNLPVRLFTDTREAREWLGVTPA